MAQRRDLGNTQHVVDLSVDCDADTLLVRVQPAGPACHTGSITCFYRTLATRRNKHGELDELYRIICERRDHPSGRSYTARLMAQGEDEILKKVGEEAIEIVLAAKGQGDQRLVEEIADLLYHLLVLLAASGLTPADIQAELAQRHKKIN